jgi:mannose-1-phosphate guanylyltransferase
MFFFQAGIVLAELGVHAPDLLKALTEKGAAAYGELEKKSIDYALMEKTTLAYILPAKFGWDDLGDWTSLERLWPATQKNVDLANHVAQDSQGCIVYATDEQEVIVTIGLEDLVIVRDRQVTLIVPKDRTQDIKKILKTLQTKAECQDLL